MLASIKQFFQNRLTTQASDSTATEEHRARLAAAALLVEVVRSDEHFSEPERAELLNALDRKFGLDAAEAHELIELAQAEVHEATDLYQFTSQINRAFSAAQKQRLIEELWRVAYSDRDLHHYEEHVIRRIANLIHVPHAAFIGAKLRAGAGTV